MKREYRGTTKSAVQKPRTWLTLFVSIALSVSLLALLVGCGEEASFEDKVDTSRTPENSLMGNPVTEMGSVEEVNASAGVGLFVPPDAQLTRCSVIEVESGDNVGELEFSLGDSTYFFRAQKSGSLQDISGLYYFFDKTLELDTGVNFCNMQFIEDGPGYINWFDDENMITYCVTMEKGASEAKLSNIATELVGIQVMG